MSDKAQSNNYVRIFDTSLRDGEQSPGATMTSTEKLEIARSLARLGVDVIEAGFPAASEDDLLAVQKIAKIVGQGQCELMAPDRVPIICGLARSTISDIDRAWEAVSPAKRPRIHTFLATSPIHREHKLRMSKAEVLARIDEMVRYARNLCEDIEFSPEDAGRTEPEFLHQAVKAAIDAGATTINIPDTVGYTVPEEFGALIAGIKKNVVGIDDVTISVHCHNDLGLATANTLAGLQNGARQAEVTINGIGERAGNTALEEVVMALRTRRPIFALDTGIDSTHIAKISQMVSHITGMRVQPNKSIVGANAFAHEAGIHQDGMLKNQDTYEIMRPESVGVTESQLVLGKHSGRHAFSVRLIDLGYHLQETELAKAFVEFKRLADTKKYVTDSDLAAIASSGLQNSVEFYALEDLQVACGTRGMATATVRLRVPDGSSRTVAILGSGPVHACFKAIDMIVFDQSEARSRLLEYSVHSCTQGIDALGEVSIRLEGNEGEAGTANEHYVQRPHRIFHGQGADTDIILASAKAYLSAINRRLASSASTHAPADRPKVGRGRLVKPTERTVHNNAANVSDV